MIGLIKEQDSVNLIMISIKASIIDEEEVMMEIDIKTIEAMIGEMMIMDLIKEVAMIETLIGIIREINIIPLEETNSHREKIIREIMETEEIMIEEMTNNRIIANSKILDLRDHKDWMIKKVENTMRAYN